MDYYDAERRKKGNKTDTGIVEIGIPILYSPGTFIPLYPYTLIPFFIKQDFIPNNN